jgi:hypothetical protein
VQGLIRTNENVESAYYCVLCLQVITVGS